MQSQAYQSGAEGGDFMKMSQGEQASVDVPHGAESEEHGKKKPSMVGKVKDKAKKLSHKIKGATKKKKDEQGNEVEGTGDTSSSSSEDEQQHEEHHPLEQQTPGAMGYRGGAPTPEARHDGAVHGGGTGDYRSRELDLDQGKKEEQGGGLLSGGTQGDADPSAPAPGSNWPRSDEELRATTNPSQEEVPAAHGQESSGISPTIASSGLGGHEDVDVRSRDPDPSSITAGALAGETEKHPEDVAKPTTGSQGEEPKRVVDGVDSSGRDLVSSEVVDDKPQGDVPAGNPSDKQLKTSDSQKGWMQTVKNVFMGSPKSTDPTATPVEGSAQEQKTWTEKARDAAVSAKDTAASKLPSSTGPQEDVPMSDQGTAEAKPGITSRAVDSATALKDTVASKIGYGQTGAQTTETPVSEADPSKPAASQGGITQKVMGVKDAVASKLGYGAGAGAGAGTGETGVIEGEKKDSKLFTPDDDDTALSQKITDMLTLGGGSKSASGSPTTDVPAGQESGNKAGGGVMDKVTGVMGSFLGKKQPEEKDSTTTTTTTASDPTAASKDVTKDTVMGDATA